MSHTNRKDLVTVVAGHKEIGTASPALSPLDLSPRNHPHPAYRRFSLGLVRFVRALLAIEEKDRDDTQTKRHRSAWDACWETNE